MDGEAIRARLSFRASVLAPRLLGWRLVRTLADGTRMAGRIVETEAYEAPEDQASHARNGRRTARTESMYAPPGTAYVYFTYGMHHCFNVSCARAGVAHAVLIRALEPVEGLEAMRDRRPKARSERDLCSGPGKLCQALGIDRDLDGIDLCLGGVLSLEPGASVPAKRRLITPRVGLGACGPWSENLWRWAEAENVHVSRGPTRNGRTRRWSAGE